MVILDVKNLSVQFGENIILDNINFGVEEGDFLLILGPNGAGKSVLIRTLLGLNRHYTGDFSIFGQPVDQVRRKIGYVPQYINFDESFPLTVREVIRMGLIGVSDQNIDQQVNEVLKLVRIEDLADDFFGELSGGQQKKVMIARALIRRPSLLIMDEPLAGIDTAGEENFYHILKRWQEKYGMTVIMISHDVSLVNKIATRVLCVNVKRICFDEANKISDESFSKLFGNKVKFHQH